MTASTPVGMVSELLEAARYRELPRPLEIAGLTFDLPTAFVGSGHSSDLVLVADTAFESPERILRKIEGVGRVLDAKRSKRPITAILAGPRPSVAIIEALSRVCRVLPVGTPVAGDATTSLKEWLAVLLPLDLPEPSKGLADPLTTISAQINDLDAAVADLVAKAKDGADGVQMALHAAVIAALDAGGDDQ